MRLLKLRARGLWHKTVPEVSVTKSTYNNCNQSSNQVHKPLFGIIGHQDIKKDIDKIASVQ